MLYLNIFKQGTRLSMAGRNVACPHGNLEFLCDDAVFVGQNHIGVSHMYSRIVM